jgi:tripartite-type tricarboxylate transporter receptor subunit TctC
VLHALSRLLYGISLGALLCAAAAQVAAQAPFPNRAIRIVVPFPPGGGADMTARTVAQRISQNIGQSVVVENRAGAGGNIGTEAVARAAPDGYTVLQTTNGHAIQPHLLKQSWDPVKDFAPVSLVNTFPLIIAVHPSVPAASLRELIAYAKANPGKLSYGSSGTGGPLHLGAEIFKSAAGVDILHIPYKGNAPMTLAVVSGEVSMVFDSLTGPLPNVRAGKLRALGITSARRAGVLPDVPTVSESGVPVVYESWNGVLAPAGTPPEIIAQLNREFVRAIAAPEVREKLSALGYEPVSNSPEQFAALIASDLERFGKIIREVGMRADD